MLQLYSEYGILLLVVVEAPTVLGWRPTSGSSITITKSLTPQETPNIGAQLIANIILKST